MRLLYKWFLVYRNSSWYHFASFRTFLLTRSDFAFHTLQSGMSSSDWFFGSNRFGPGGPAYHGGRNDHPAAFDRTTAFLTLAAVTLYLPFVLSVVTARRRRIPTFLG